MIFLRKYKKYIIVPYKKHGASIMIVDINHVRLELTAKIVFRCNYLDRPYINAPFDSDVFYPAITTRSKYKYKFSMIIKTPNHKWWASLYTLNKRYFIILE